MSRKSSQDVEVLIIGCGAGGASCAWALSSQGVNVTVLEAGPWYNPLKDYTLNKPDWERRLFPQPKAEEMKYTFGDMQAFDPKWDDLRSWNHISGRSFTAKRRRGWKYHHVRGVGGSTLHFTGEAHRLNPKNMQMRTLYSVAADWPLSYEELEPFYAEAERVIGVAGANNDQLRPRSAAYPLPPHEPSYASRHIISGLQRLGLSWSPNALAILSRSYDDRPGCNYCANCNRGCPRFDKGSADITFARKAVATGKCSIVTGATVQAIEPGANDRVRAVEYVNSSGARQSIRTKVVVVAAGAIATPRLLMLSGSAAAPAGLANDSGLVGRNLMETLFWISSGLHEEPLGSYRGLPTDIICWDYNSPDSIPGVVGGCRFGPATAEADLIGPVNYAQRVVKGWGHAHKRAMSQEFGRALSIGTIGESLPNEHSYIELDPSVNDEHNLPVAKIHSFLDDMAIRRLLFMAQKSREILKASGVSTIFEEYTSYDFFSSTHVFGTCRMGRNPHNSVVNRHCRSHRWKNLYICDASVFPSSGGGEAPSLTIEALGIRLGRHLRDVLVHRAL